MFTDNVVVGMYNVIEECFEHILARCMSPEEFFVNKKMDYPFIDLYHCIFKLKFPL